MKKIVLISVTVTILIIGIWYAIDRAQVNKAKETARIAEEEEEKKKQEEQSATKSPDILYLGKVEGEAEGEVAGLATIINLQDHNFISFNEEYKVSDCSDATLYLGNNGKSDPETRIGLMTSNEKSQNYEIPSGLDVSKYEEVWIICETSSKPLGSVKLVKNGTEKIE